MSLLKSISLLFRFLYGSKILLKTADDRHRKTVQEVECLKATLDGEDRWFKAAGTCRDERADNDETSGG